MTVNDYIKQRFQGFGVILTDADLLEISFNSGVDGEDEMDESVFTRVSIAIAQFIPSLLLRPTSWSVSENGHSKSESWDKEAMKDYYAYLCKLYGLDDEFTDKPKVRFL